MADGVFHERLENEVRHLGVEHIGVRVDGDLEAIAEANLLDVQVVADELELLLERHLLLSGAVEHASQ